MSSPAPQPHRFEQPLRRRGRSAASGEAPSAPAARLDAASVEAVARRVVELLGQGPPRTASRLVDAKTLAAELGVERSWVYAHRDELAHIRLGGGANGRLRFDLEAARQAFAAQQRPAGQRAESCAVAQRCE